MEANSNFIKGTRFALAGCSRRKGEGTREGGRASGLRPTIRLGEKRNEGTRGCQWHCDVPASPGGLFPSLWLLGQEPHGSRVCPHQMMYRREDPPHMQGESEG